MSADTTGDVVRDNGDPFVTGDLDIGGTFTDGFFTFGSRVITVKVDTTPHDLTVCFWECLLAGATRLGFESPVEMLSHTRVLRFATTVGTNAILQGTGPKLGMLVTKGEEERIYAEFGEVSPLRPLLVSGDLAIGVVERSDEKVAPEIDPDEIRTAIKTLLERGAREIVVALANDGLSGTMERGVRDVVRHHYPTHYLGSVPLVLSTEVRPRIDDFTRANIAAINAYLTPGLARALYRAEDRLRGARYPYPLLITHAGGGAARVAKTRAIDTYNSGPSAGLFGAARFARSYDLAKVITVDVGGTSTDLGVLQNGAPVYDFDSSIAEIPVQLPFYKLSSIGGGGGSIASVGANGVLTVGPDSAGAVPGPACYGLGGNDATITDAAVVLGSLDPNNFLGGQRKLDPKAARRVIEVQIADALQISAEEASLRVISGLGASLAAEIRSLLTSDGDDAEPWRLFMYGGAAGLFAAQLARELGTDAWLFRQGSVFNAFGSSSMDVVHLYERAIGGLPAKGLVDQLVSIADDLEAQSRRDMRAEGFDEVNDFQLEIEIRDADSGGVSVLSHPLESSWQATIGPLMSSLKEATELLVLRLRARARVPRREIAQFDYHREDGSAAIQGERSAWTPAGRIDMPVYAREALQHGNLIVGPALIDAEDTTIVIPEGFQLEVDSFLNVRLTSHLGGSEL